MRTTWLPVLIYGIFAGLSTICTLRTARVEVFAEKSPGLFLTLFYLAAISMLIFFIWAWGRLFSLLNGMTCKKSIARMLISYLCIVAIGCIFGVFVIGAFWLLTRHNDVTPLEILKDNWLVCLICFIVFVLLALPLEYSFTQYMMKREANILPDLPKSYPTGLRHLGFIFITMLITGIITTIISIVITMPQTILVTAQTISAIGVLQGDPPGMPGYFIPLHGATTAITAIMFFYLSAFLLIVTVFMYGSIEKDEEEKISNFKSQINDVTPSIS